MSGSANSFPAAHILISRACERTAHTLTESFSIIRCPEERSPWMKGPLFQINLRACHHIPEEVGGGSRPARSRERNCCWAKLESERQQCRLVNLMQRAQSHTHNYFLGLLGSSVCTCGIYLGEKKLTVFKWRPLWISLNFDEVRQRGGQVSNPCRPSLLEAAKSETPDWKEPCHNCYIYRFCCT